MAQKCNSPFLVHKTYEGKKDFDKYYLDVQERQVFKETGEVDKETGDKLGVVEQKLLINKVDIDEFIESQADSVGIDAYIKALALQGENIDNFSTAVKDDIVDYSMMPDTLADTLAIGDKAKELFEKMDPALKGNHTTIDGFLNSLTQETIDNYIKGRIEALSPKVDEKKGV